MLDHFDEFSTVFGRDGAMLSVLLVVSLALTAFHVYQEWKGGAVPLWRVFGAIVGVRLPDRLGFLLFTVVLTLVLWALSVQGMTGWPLAFEMVVICARSSNRCAHLGQHRVALDPLRYGLPAQSRADINATLYRRGGLARLRVLGGSVVASVRGVGRRCRRCRLLRPCVALLLVPWRSLRRLAALALGPGDNDP